MPFAALPDLNMYYERAGAGEPLLFISGTGGDLRRPATDFDRRLAERFTVLAFDQRLWVRISAQIYNEASDFEALARAVWPV